MTKKFILPAMAAAALCCPAHAKITGQWKTYASFDNSAVCIIPTPEKTYFLGLAQPYNTGYADFSEYEGALFSYDPAADEIVSLGRDNYLSSTSIKCIRYNSKKRYLAIAYVDGNIDLLYDDGSVKNIDALRIANISTSREPNGITFDYDNNHIYIAGNFGYIVINDDSAKVDDSRLYSQPVAAVTRIGDNIVLATQNALLSAPAAAKRFKLEEYAVAAQINNISDFMPCADNNLLVRNGKLISQVRFDKAGKAAEINTILEHSNIKAVTDCKEGYFVCTGGGGTLIANDLKKSTFKVTPDAENNTVTGTWDGREIWQINPRKGLASFSYDGDKYTATRSGMFPNVPNAYRCHNGIAYSPKYGVLVNNHEVNVLFPTYNMKIPALTSGLKNGIWTAFGYPYTNPAYASSLTEPNGLTIDPDNPDYIYYGSFKNGVQRKNLADPQDVLHLTHPSDKAAALKGYHKLDDDDPNWKDYFSFCPPAFDNDGNLWMLRAMAATTQGFVVYVWPADARKNNDPSKIKSWTINTTKNHQFRILPLKHHSNRNLILISTGHFENKIYIIDTNGTPTENNDDKVAVISAPTDQDGGRISSNYVYDIVEDPDNGTVWVVGAGILYTFRPTDAMKDPSNVNRIKVARDDGTNLADYLLDNVTIYKMAIDSKGRKWFATNGGGIVVTSPDGKNIIDEINTGNSEIPADVVYTLVNNPAENSMVVSTNRGIAEFLMSGEAAGNQTNSQVKVYPNPVRPDFLGWVTIENIPDNAVVKICDASGNLVKELGIAENGVAKWDVTNQEMKRVRSGVYNIFSSSATEGVDDAPCGKILVIN